MINVRAAPIEKRISAKMRGCLLPNLAVILPPVMAPMAPPKVVMDGIRESSESERSEKRADWKYASTELKTERE